jgi:molybdopterin converting factor small subunit
VNVNVKFIGSFRTLSDSSKLALTFEEPVKFRDVVKKVAEEFPNLRQMLNYRECKDQKANMLVLVNGKELSVLDGLDTIISDGDELVFVPIIHGG